MPNPKVVARVRWTVAVALLLLAAACDEGGAPDRSPASSPSRSVSPSAEASPNGELLVWADAPLVQVIQRLGQAAGFDLTVEEVSAELAPAQLAASPTPGRRAPDVVVLAHDSLGPLVAQGALAPLDPPAGSDAFLPVATSAFSLGGHLYGLPFAVENVALIRNTELVPEALSAFEEVERVALQLQDEGKVDVPLGLPVPDPYHEYPLFTALGGYVFGRNVDGSYDPQDLGLDGPQSLHAAEEFGQWRADGLIDP
jgi:arabinogalactan oligomer / maltooligosaccharide transport system substrate-binding protein